MVAKLKPGIRVFDFMSIDDPEDQGTYETWWGQAYVHVKVHNEAKPYMLANELIAARLAAALGLPVLPGEVARDFNGKDCWVTPRVSESGNVSPPPATEAQITAEFPNVVAGMLAFDSWIHNVDRTADNVMFDPRLGIWLIDHENSLAEPDGRAFNSAKAADAARMPLSWHGFSSTPIDSDALHFWRSRIEILSRHVIERPLEEASQRGLLTKQQTTWILSYLLERRSQLRRLIPETQRAPKSPPLVSPTEDDEQYRLL